MDWPEKIIRDEICRNPKIVQEVELILREAGWSEAECDPSIPGVRLFHPKEWE